METSTFKRLSIQSGLCLATGAWLYGYTDRNNYVAVAVGLVVLAGAVAALLPSIKGSSVANAIKKAIIASGVIILVARLFGLITTRWAHGNISPIADRSYSFSYDPADYFRMILNGSLFGTISVFLLLGFVLTMLSLVAKVLLGSSERRPIAKPIAKPAMVKEAKAEPVVTDIANRTDLYRLHNISDSDVETLNKNDINSLEDLINNSKTGALRTDLASKTGFSRGVILTWLNHADLMRIEGVEGDLAYLLEKSGVDSVKELARRKSVNLQERMQRTNRSEKIVKTIPSVSDLSELIKTAERIK
jgi:hypothetical protein